MGFRIGVPLFAAAAVDGHAHVYFHDVPSRLPKRLAGIVLALLVTAALTRISARRRDLGRASPTSSGRATRS